MAVRQNSWNIRIADEFKDPLSDLAKQKSEETGLKVSVTNLIHSIIYNHLAAIEASEEVAA